MDWRNRNLFNSLILILIALILTSCASSNVARETADALDTSYYNSESVIKNAANNDPLNVYENSSSAGQGLVVGSLAGGLTALAMGGGAGVLPGMAGGAVVGGIFGAYISKSGTLADKLENRGVKVFVMGDQVMLVLPSASIFSDKTSEITYHAYSTLDLVGEYIKHYAKTGVKVAAYTDGLGSARLDHALSEQQAQKVVRYLWSKVNARLLYAVGMGNQKLVSPAGSAANYRLEITFEKLPV